MIRNLKTKMIATLLLTIMLISNIIQLVPLLESNAASVGDSIFIESIGTVQYHLQSHATTSGGYVITHLAGYHDNGKFYPAYCLDHDLHGVEDGNGYNVTLTQLLKDTETYNKVWRTTVAGYPYHTADELGVSDWTYAYQATKMAIYCVMGQANVNDFYATDTIGQQIVDLIKRLVNEGNNGSATYKTPVAEITKVGDVTLDGNYYIQKYNLTTNLDLSDFTLAISNFPNGTILTDLNGNAKNTFNAGEQFQVKMPKDEFEKQDINGRIRATVKTKEYAIFYGSSYNAQTQDYALTADPISLNSCSSDLSIKNNKSSIKIYKYNEDKSAPIKDVTFELLKEDGTVIKTVKTDENGIATFDKLYKGKYFAREKDTVKGYLLNDETIEISVDYASTTEATMMNKEPTGEIKLIKTDSETGNQDRADKTSHHGDATLEGTEYTLYAQEDIYNVAKTIKYFSKDDVIAKYIFNSYGNAVVKITNTSTTAKLESKENVLKGLPMGLYYVKETVVPQGYLQDGNTHSIELKYKDKNTPVIKVEKTLTNDVEKGRFEVIKMSSDTNTTAPIVEGAEFTAILTKYVDYYGSFNEALKHLNEFAEDEYSIFKTESNGHSISGLLAYGKYTVNETYCPSNRINPVKEFNVVIDKNSNGPQKELIENDTPFKSYIKMIKKDKKSGKDVTFSNTTFSLYKLNEETREWERVSCKLGRESFDTWTTDENAIAYTETKLDAGTYKIDEIKVPDGYLQLDEECTFEVNRDNQTLEYDKDMDAYITVEVKNEQPTGTLIIDKSVAIRQDIDTSLVDISDLSGIEFKLTAKEDIIDYADGSIIYKKGQEVKTFNVDKNGNYTIAELPMGIYELQEIKTLDGLVLNDEKYEIKFEQKDLTTKVYEDRKDIVNDTTIFEFSKKSITGDDELEGANLQVIDKDGKIIDEWTSGNKTHKIEGLKVGETYTLRETITPNGYVKATDIEFTVDNTKDIQKIEMIDKIVEMTKVDIGGEELEGAKIQVFDKDNKLVDEWVSSKEPHRINGLVEKETYTLHEEVAIEGYVKATDIEFTVTEDKETQKIEMIDKIVQVTKTDLTTGEELEGAELVVTDENGNVIDEWTSTKEPHNITGLEEGKTYTLTEKTCPYGYEQAESIEFTVTEDKETQKIEMKDMPILKNIRIIKADSSTKEIIKDNFKFGIYEDAECNKLIKEVASNKEDGTVTFEDLRYGTYYIKELKQPHGYQLSNKVLKLDINDKGVFIDDVQIEEKDDIYSFTFYNDLLPKVQTGNEMNYILLSTLMGLSLIGITTGIVVLKKKNRKDK